VGCVGGGGGGGWVLGGVLLGGGGGGGGGGGYLGNALCSLPRPPYNAPEWPVHRVVFPTVDSGTCRSSLRTKERGKKEGRKMEEEGGK